MKRFYEQAVAIEVSDGCSVTLDDRPVKTPAKNSLVVPTMALAEALAAEWQAQGEDIKPASMTLTQLANSAVDMVGERRLQIVDIIADFANADLLCYQASDPEELVVRQQIHWSPLITWAEKRFAVTFVITNGISHVEQTPEMLAAYRNVIEVMDNFRLSAIHEMAVLSQSITVALALAEDQSSVDVAWAAARVDENYQATKWGLDSEAEARANTMKSELAAAKVFYQLLDL